MGVDEDNRLQFFFSPTQNGPLDEYNMEFLNTWRKEWRPWFSHWLWIIPRLHFKQFCSATRSKNTANGRHPLCDSPGLTNEFTANIDFVAIEGETSCCETQAHFYSLSYGQVRCHTWKSVADQEQFSHKLQNKSDQACVQTSVNSSFSNWIIVWNTWCWTQLCHWKASPSLPPLRWRRFPGLSVFIRLSLKNVDVNMHATGALFEAQFVGYYSIRISIWVFTTMHKTLWTLHLQNIYVLPMSARRPERM